MDGKGGRGPSLNRVKLSHAPDDAALRAVIANGIPPEMPEGWFLSETEVGQLAEYVRGFSKIEPEVLPGDAGRGAQVYAARGCGGCHIVAGQGSGFGTELTDVGARRSASHIEKTIMQPTATLPETFLLVQVTTAGGQILRGIRVNEDTFTIQFKDAAGQFYSLDKRELRELRKLRGETPMPSFANLLSSSERQDLVAYLASLRGKQ
jgi:cytochrome c oxidase cbb3-type subunit III